MASVSVIVKYGPGSIVQVIGPGTDQCIQLYPGSEVLLRFYVYEKEKKKK